MRRTTLRIFVFLLLAAQTLGMSAARRLHFESEAQSFGHTPHLQTPGESSCVPNPDHDCPTCRILTAFAVPGAPRPALHRPPTLSPRIAPHASDEVSVYRLVLPEGPRPPPTILTSIV
jgi:hypothetical protein